MSNHVTNICRPAQMPPTAKNVLMAIADRADDSGFAWPSIPGLCEATCYGRTAVIEAMKWLEAMGYVTVEKSAGRQNRITVDLQTLANAPKAVRGTERTAAVRGANQSAPRTGCTAEPVRQTDYTRPPDGPPPVRLPDGVVREPDPNHQQPPEKHQVAPKEAIQSKSVRAKAVQCPPDVAPQVWADWNQLRRQKKAPVTQTVLDGARVEAEKAGMTLESFLGLWCVRGSQGLQANWLKSHERGPNPKGMLGSIGGQLAQSRAKAERLLDAIDARGT